MGMRRKHRHSVALPGQADVLDVASEPLQEALVFNPPHSLSDAELGHFRPPLNQSCIWSNVNRERPSAPARGVCPPPRQRSSIKPPPRKAEQSLRHEDDHG